MPKAISGYWYTFKNFCLTLPFQGWVWTGGRGTCLWAPATGRMFSEVGCNFLLESNRWCDKLCTSSSCPANWNSQDRLGLLELKMAKAWTLIYSFISFEYHLLFRDQCFCFVFQSLTNPFNTYHTKHIGDVLRSNHYHMCNMVHRIFKQILEAYYKSLV